MTQTAQPGTQLVMTEAARTAAAPAVPTAADERLEVLDVLRGFALYGVLLANTVQLFSGRMFLPRAQLLAQDGAADQVFLTLLNVFIDGKAMTLLTFLFGLGFALQLQRAEIRGRSVVPTYLRRLAALAFIGVCHVLLLWWGDILWGYAIAGIGLLLFRRVRGWKLVVWAFGLAMVPQVVASLPVVAKALAPIMPKPVDGAAFNAQVLAAISGHSRRVLTELHLKQTYYHVGRFWVPYFPWLLGRFLIGYWAGTTRLFHQAAERLPFFRKLAGWGLVLGIAGSSIPLIHRLLDRWKVVFSESVWRALAVPTGLGGILLTCGYAAGVVLLMQRSAAARVLLRIAPVGQMALTTYLGQSLICTFLFYGWGLGLVNRIQPVLLLPVTLAVFTVQILFAHAWLARFRFGPMEWLWRSLTYGRIQPLRRS